MLDEKLSRIAALRPIERSRSESGPSRRLPALELARLLSAEIIENRLGSHLVVRRRFSGPHPLPIAPTALELLAPNAGEEIHDCTRWLFLDTETTGLSGGTGTYAFLVGLAWWADGGLTVEQLFMRDHSDEPSLLLELARNLTARPVLVTFNGKSFDWPLLETRYRMARMDNMAEPDHHLDLLHPARQLWRHLLESVALTHIERHILALDRGDDIPSETIPRRYFEFLRGGPVEPIAEVFRHNEMDLRGLAMLANHMTRVLESPESAGCDGGELYGISKMLRRRGRRQQADTTLEQAVAQGVPSSGERSARRDLAYLARRERDFVRANALWENLLGSTRNGLEAYEQLAIHYEHRAHDPQRALALTRDALSKLHQAAQDGRTPAHSYHSWHRRLQHRLNRLSRMTSRSATT